jgi:hypothetical protein
MPCRQKVAHPLIAVGIWPSVSPIGRPRLFAESSSAPLAIAPLAKSTPWSSCARRRKRVDWFPEGELRMSDRNFEALVDRARRIEMTPPEKEAQRRSFAYGNANIENSAVTREVVDKAATALAAEEGAPSRSPGR